MIHIPLYLEQAIIAKAEQQGVSVQDFIANLVIQNPAPPTINPMIARSMAHKNPSALGDGVVIQRALRDEWD